MIAAVIRDDRRHTVDGRRHEPEGSAAANTAAGLVALIRIDAASTHVVTKTKVLGGAARDIAAKQTSPPRKSRAERFQAPIDRCIATRNMALAQKASADDVRYSPSHASNIALSGALFGSHHRDLLAAELHGDARLAVGLEGFAGDAVQLDLGLLAFAQPQPSTLATALSNGMSSPLR